MINLSLHSQLRSGNESSSHSDYRGYYKLIENNMILNNKFIDSDTGKTTTNH